MRSRAESSGTFWFLQGEATTGKTLPVSRRVDILQTDSPRPFRTVQTDVDHLKVPGTCQAQVYSSMREAKAEAVCPSIKSSPSLEEFASTIKSF